LVMFTSSPLHFRFQARHDPVGEFVGLHFLFEHRDWLALRAFEHGAAAITQE
jgi:hypothetical protein